MSCEPAQMHALLLNHCTALLPTRSLCTQRALQGGATGRTCTLACWGWACLGRPADRSSKANTARQCRDTTVQHLKSHSCQLLRDGAATQAGACTATECATLTA